MKFFSIKQSVLKKHLDDLSHVNNIQYLCWVQEAAKLHWEYLVGEDINELDAEDRAHKGIFLSFQYPVEIPGVSVTNFIKTAINESRKAQGLDDMNSGELLKKIRQKSKLLDKTGLSEIEIDSNVRNKIKFLFLIKK